MAADAQTASVGSTTATTTGLTLVGPTFYPSDGTEVTVSVTGLGGSADHSVGIYCSPAAGTTWNYSPSGVYPSGSGSYSSTGTAPVGTHAAGCRLYLYENGAGSHVTVASLSAEYDDGLSAGGPAPRTTPAPITPITAGAYDPVCQHGSRNDAAAAIDGYDVQCNWFGWRQIEGDPTGDIDAASPMIPVDFAVGGAVSDSYYASTVGEERHIGYGWQLYAGAPYGNTAQRVPLGVTEPSEVSAWVKAWLQGSGAACPPEDVVEATFRLDLLWMIDQDGISSVAHQYGDTETLATRCHGAGDTGGDWEQSEFVGTPPVDAVSLRIGWECLSGNCAAVTVPLVQLQITAGGLTASGPTCFGEQGSGCTPSTGYNGLVPVDPNSGLLVCGPFSGRCDKPFLTPFALTVCVSPSGPLDVTGWLAYIACLVENVPMVIGNIGIAIANAFIDLIFPSDNLRMLLVNANADISSHVPFTWIDGAVEAINEFYDAPSEGTSLPVNITVLDRTVPIGSAATGMSSQMTGYRGTFVVLLYVGFAYGLLQVALGFFGKRNGADHSGLGQFEGW